MYCTVWWFSQGSIPKVATEIHSGEVEQITEWKFWDTLSTAVTHAVSYSEPVYESSAVYNTFTGLPLGTTVDVLNNNYVIKSRWFSYKVETRPQGNLYFSSETIFSDSPSALVMLYVTPLKIEKDAHVLNVNLSL